MSGNSEQKKNSTDHRTANTILQLVVAVKKKNFLVHFFSEQVTYKGNSPQTS